MQLDHYNSFLFPLFRLSIGSSLTGCVPVNLCNYVIRTFTSDIDTTYPLIPCTLNSFIFSFFFFNQISLHLSCGLNPPSYFNFIVFWNFYYTVFFKRILRSTLLVSFFSSFGFFYSLLVMIRTKMFS